MTFQEFIDKYNGKSCEVGGSPNALNQCVDLANAYLIEVCGLPGIFNTNAIDFPSKAGDKFDYIQNTPDGVPQRGDLVIFDIGPYGHISIFVDGSSTYLNTFDQNWPKILTCRIVKHDYTKVVGWLRPKVTQENIIDKILTDEGIDTEGELREVIGHHKDYPIILADKESCNRDLSQLKEQLRVKDSVLEELNQEIKSNKVALDESRKAYDQFFNKLLQKLQPLDVVNDEATILAEIDKLIAKEDQQETMKKKLETANIQVDTLTNELRIAKSGQEVELPSFWHIIKLILWRKARR